MYSTLSAEVEVVLRAGQLGESTPIMCSNVESVQLKNTRILRLKYSFRTAIAYCGNFFLVDAGQLRKGLSA